MITGSAQDHRQIEMSDTNGATVTVASGGSELSSYRRYLILARSLSAAFIHTTTMPGPEFLFLAAPVIRPQESLCKGCVKAWFEEVPLGIAKAVERFY